MLFERESLSYFCFWYASCCRPFTGNAWPLSNQIAQASVKTEPTPPDPLSPSAGGFPWATVQTVETGNAAAMAIDNGQKLLCSYLVAGNKRMFFLVFIFDIHINICIYACMRICIAIYIYIYFIALVVERK